MHKSPSDWREGNGSEEDGGRLVRQGGTLATASRIMPGAREDLERSCKHRFVPSTWIAGHETCQRGKMLASARAARESLWAQVVGRLGQRRGARALGLGTGTRGPDARDRGGAGVGRTTRSQGPGCSEPPRPPHAEEVWVPWQRHGRPWLEAVGGTGAGMGLRACSAWRGGGGGGHVERRGPAGLL